VIESKTSTVAFYNSHKSAIITGLLVVGVLLYFAYFAGALSYRFGDEGSIRLLWVTILVVVVLALALLFQCLRPQLESLSASKPVSYARQNYRRINWFVALSYKRIRLLPLVVW